MKTPNLIVRWIAALLGLWMVVCGWGLWSGGASAPASEGAGVFLSQASGCCARKPAAASCCPGGAAQCCVKEKSGRPAPMPALPVPSGASPLPEWVAAVLEHLQLPDLAAVRPVPVASLLGERRPVRVPLFLRDRVLLI